MMGPRERERVSQYFDLTILFRRFAARARAFIQITCRLSLFSGSFLSVARTHPHTPTYARVPHLRLPPGRSVCVRFLFSFSCACANEDAVGGSFPAERSQGASLRPPVKLYVSRRSLRRVTLAHSPADRPFLLSSSDLSIVERRSLALPIFVKRALYT